MRALVKAVAVILTVAACGKSPDAKPAETDKKFTIAMIAKSSTNPVFLASRTGAAAAAKQLSDSLHLTVEVVWLTPADVNARLDAAMVLPWIWPIRPAPRRAIEIME